MNRMDSGWGWRSPQSKIRVLLPEDLSLDDGGVETTAAVVGASVHLNEERGLRVYQSGFSGETGGIRDLSIFIAIKKEDICFKELMEVMLGLAYRNP